MELSIPTQEFDLGMLKSRPFVTSMNCSMLGFMALNPILKP